MRIPSSTRLLPLFLVSITLSTATAQEVDSATRTVFGDLIELGRQLQIETADGEQLEFQATPVLNWNNPTRGAGQKGCVFVWLDHGRPSVIGSVFTYGNEKQINMRHEMHSLTAGPLTARYRDQVTWSPSEPGIEWQTIANVPKPRDDARSRLIQMRRIARQYTATLERPNGNQTELELKPTPLYRYASAKAKVVDGAIFSLAVGTDPEVLLLVEATGAAPQQASWRVGFARFHYWKAFVRNGKGETVWRAKQVMELLPSSIGDARSVAPVYTSYLVERREIEPQ